MYIDKPTKGDEKIIVNIPLTTTSWKTRVKNRSVVFEYWIPFASRTNTFIQSNYIEWQIWYDIEIWDKEKLELTTLKDIIFTAYNGKTKALYELSEYVYYFFSWWVISITELNSIKDYLNSIQNEDLIDSHKDCRIKRTNPIIKQINEIEFFESKVEYPLLVHKFWNYELITEIIIKEKQRAVWTQPMLYFCFPITELKTEKQLLWRIADKNEFAKFTFDKNNYSIILEMLKIFWILSPSHKADIIAIIDLILKS